ncbi:hypothetical protein Back11_40650 [Paenibacillus baekrokdamisoli]|uniref:Uncharacterized protein n=1 Tax=Paenibacillus baekrokdamisoli TaxID=1712516 RepID=A0A3G9IV97_9BACL|nr:hypothetical protein [Paenibacillus baekrokdamisoli]MBB3068238.1 hypothetical protein [Paenibacillus baekrokdamisoli]BBH22720.1 hypothetical protein Back11_40650 [Paenibacillus baekrokdamisoli]
MALKLGDSKESIDGLFGVSDNTDVFNMNMYPLFSVHYNEKGLLDAWKMDIDSNTAEANPLFITNKGIVLGKSTLFDVLQQYGTVGYEGDGMANYLYEKTTYGSFRSPTSMSSYFQIKAPEKVFVISFLFDKTTLKVTYINVSWLPYARGDVD